MKISKRETQRLARRAQIVSVARKHFFEFGYDGAVMSAIAAELGGSKRTLWSYFPSKQALFAAVIEDTVAAVRGGIVLSASGGTPSKVLETLCRSAIEQMTSPIVLQLYRLVSPLAERNPEIGQMFYERGPRRTQQLIGDFLRDNFASLLATDDFVQAGKDLFALAVSDLHFEAIWGINASPSANMKDARAKHAVRLFLRAYSREFRAEVPTLADSAAMQA